MNKTVEQVLRTMAAEVDSKLRFIEFAIYSLVNVSTIKSTFELIYGQQVQNILYQLDGLHTIESVQQFVMDITKLVAEAK